jgi:uncharacterized protein YbjT (DUF2867 family)
MRAKVVQEKTIAASGLRYRIVRATQFQEFADLARTVLAEQGIDKAVVVDP